MPLFNCQGTEDLESNHTKRAMAICQRERQTDFRKQVKPNNKQTNPVGKTSFILSFPKKTLLFLNHFFFFF